MKKKCMKYYVFKKSASVMSLIDGKETSNKAQTACEIIAAHENAVGKSKEYCALYVDNPHLKPIAAWHELSNTRFYSIELTTRMCELWDKEVKPHLWGESEIITSSFYNELRSYLNDAVNIIKNRGERCMLNHINHDLAYRLRTALDDYLDDCCEDINDLLINAFNLKVYH